MFPPRVRLVILAVVAALGAAEAARGRGAGWVLLVGAALLGYGAVRHGTVWIAFRAYRRGDLDAMERHLRGVWKPQWLRPEDRAYHDLLAGVAAHRRGDAALARRHFAAALAGPLPTTNIRAVAHYHAAGASLDDGDPAAARDHLASARELPHAAALDAPLAAVEERLPGA